MSNQNNIPLERDYGSPVEWSVGSLFAHDRFMLKLFDVLDELGCDNPVKSVFGSLPCRLQGGRLAPYDMTLHDAERLVQRHNEHRVGCMLTFSSTIAAEKDLRDEKSNELLKIINVPDAGNGVLASSELVRDYVRSEYPHLSASASIVKPSCETRLGDTDTPDYYNNLLGSWDSVSLNPLRAIDPEFTRGLKDPHRITVTANGRCVPNCPNAGDCYQTKMGIEKKVLDDGDAAEDFHHLDELERTCSSLKRMYPLAGTSLPASTIAYLARHGINHFRLEGRDNRGECFVRDMGDYIFDPCLFNRISEAILGRAV